MRWACCPKSALGRPSFDRLNDFLRVYSRLGGKDEKLAHSYHLCRHHDLVARLSDLTRAAFANMGDRLPIACSRGNTSSKASDGPLP